jgi:hypothetical protein
LFYSTGKTLYEIFRRAGTKTLGLDSFKAIINPIADYTLSASDLESVFTHVSRYRIEITFTEFEEAFRYQIPIKGNIQAETIIIQKIREWMFSRQYPTEGAFQRLIRAADRLAESTLARVDFHKACIINQIKLNAPEMDFLFDMLTNN